MLHKHKTEIIKMKWNIGALQFYKKLKNKRRSLLLFHMGMATYKMHAFMRQSYFLYFFFFSFLCCSHKNDLNNAFAFTRVNSEKVKIFCLKELIPNK